MNPHRPGRHPKCIATVCLSGTLPEKLEAAAAAGFDGIEIFESDLLNFDGSPARVRQMAADLGLAIMLYQPFLQQVTAAVGEVAYLSVLDEWELVFISRTSTSRVMSTGFVLGARVPAPLASAGVMMLAAQPEQAVKAWLETCVLTPYTPYTILQRERLLDEIRKASRQDYAVVEQQLQIGVRGVAVPLRDRQGNVIAALSVNMQVGEETTEQALQRVLQVLQDTALSIMRVL